VTAITQEFRTDLDPNRGRGTDLAPPFLSCCGASGGYAGVMAAAGGRGSRGKGAGRPRAAGAGRTPGRKPGAGARGTTSATSEPAPPLPTGPFRLGAIEGATPGKWIDAWKQRMPQIPLELVPLDLPDQRAALIQPDPTGLAQPVDAALVRLPIDRTGLHVIALYDETPVVVCAAESHLTAADELTADDLAGEVLIVPEHPPVQVEVPGTTQPRFAAPATVADAIAIAATGVGIVIVPMSLARLHHRKDAAHRPLVDGPTSTVALAWPATADGENGPLVDTFIGILRGRTANSSR